MPTIPLRPSAIIFDFDGVLVDSERYWGPLLTDMLRSAIPGFREEDEKRCKGLNVHDTYAMLQREFGLTMGKEDYLAGIGRITDEIYGKLCAPMPGALALLERLAEAHVPAAIASSSQRAWIDTALDRFDIADHFRAIATAQETEGRGKPHPDVYLLAARKLGSTPEACLAIEDSRTGMASAKAAGMFCVGLRSDLNAEQDLSAADRMVTELESLVDMLG